MKGNLATVLTILGRYDEAEAVAGRALELQPNSSLNHYLIARIHLLRGNPEAALREAQAESGAIYRNLGIALAHTARGETDNVLEWLERAYEAHDPRVINTTSEDLLKPYHSTYALSPSAERSA